MSPEWCSSQQQRPPRFNPIAHLTFFFFLTFPSCPPHHASRPLQPWRALYHMLGLTALKASFRVPGLTTLYSLMGISYVHSLTSSRASLTCLVWPVCTALEHSFPALGLTCLYTPQAFLPSAYIDMRIQPSRACSTCLDWHVSTALKGFFLLALVYTVSFFHAFAGMCVQPSKLI